MPAMYACNVFPLPSPEVGLQASDAHKEGKGREGKGREGKGREGDAFRRQLNEKPSIIAGCPGDTHNKEVFNSNDMPTAFSMANITSATAWQHR